MTENTITSAVLAGIDNSTVEAGGAVSIAADANSAITADSVAIGVSVSVGSGSVSVAGAVGVAMATNSIGGSTQALITNNSSLTADGAVAVEVDDLASISSNVVAATVAISVSSGDVAGALGVSVALAENTISGSSRAAIDNSTVLAHGALSDVTVDATAMNTIESVAAAMSFALAASSGTLALSGAGSGADARNVTTNQVLAEIIDANVTAGGGVSVTLIDQSTIKADTASAAASISLANDVALSGVVAVTVAENQVGGTYRASIDNSASPLLKIRSAP